MGISDSLLRLSVGIELAEDLVADLCGALDEVATAARAGPTDQGLSRKVADEADQSDNCVWRSVSI
jgi:hypothetical protein